MKVNNKVAIRILQGSAVIQIVLGVQTVSPLVVKFSVVLVSQNFEKLINCRPIYLIIKRYIGEIGVNSRSLRLGACY